MAESTVALLARNEKAVEALEPAATMNAVCSSCGSSNHLTLVSDVRERETTTNRLPCTCDRADVAAAFVSVTETEITEETELEDGRAVGAPSRTVGHTDRTVEPDVTCRRCFNRWQKKGQPENELTDRAQSTTRTVLRSRVVCCACGRSEDVGEVAP